jgi:Mrp family chromosome partitioning ATPase
MPSNIIQEAGWPNTGRARTTPGAPVSNGTSTPTGTPPPNAGAGASIRSASRGPDGELMLLGEMGEVIHVATPPVTEAIRYMLARLRLDNADLPERLGLTSALRGEGVTFVTRSLALVLTSDAARNVCIVDLNWASPSDWIDGPPPVGVADVLRDGLPLDQAFVTTGNHGLSFLPAGVATVADRPVLANSTELEAMLNELGGRFHHVLLDLPAVHATSEALTLAEYSSAVALVVNQGVTPESQVKSALDQLAGVPMTGLILNRATSKIPRLVRRRMTGI